MHTEITESASYVQVTEVNSFCIYLEDQRMLVPIIHSKLLAAFLHTSRDQSSLFFVCMCRKKKGADKIYDRKSSL